MKNEFNLNEMKHLEKVSSCFTLSDMEIFIFPELLYPLVLANIMSPVLWKWKEEDWFKNIETKSPTYKINRIKQYIMDHYVFNLDLETWGLTTQEKEIERFKKYFPVEVLSQSNALFGYEGDKYYFDIDIRKHFGLDKYNSADIPYWKTETIEAMNAFKFLNSGKKGAGECVSLAALYAAAMFVVGRIPLEDIYLISTPLHSQNFLNINDGVITNNRRIVTKNMWFNGTPLSSKARRALENEKITIVTHITGFIHTLYNEATIDKDSYLDFQENLSAFLKSDISSDIFTSFLRQDTNYQNCFQYRHIINGNKYYIEAERLFQHEINLKTCISAKNRLEILDAIDLNKFSISPLQNRLFANDFEEFIYEQKSQSPGQVKEFFTVKTNVLDKSWNSPEQREKIQGLYDSFIKFSRIEPRFPSLSKTFIKQNSLKVIPTATREEIFQYLVDQSEHNEMALLSLYVYRQMDKVDWRPFLKASFERNPVSLNALRGKSLNEVYGQLLSLPDDSIYDSVRLALPDEVWNFQRGDGVEKAILLASFAVNSLHASEVYIEVNTERVDLFIHDCQFRFTSSKNLVLTKFRI